MNSNILKLLILIFLLPNYSFATDYLTKKITRLEKTANCRIGVSAIHIESGKFVDYRADERFHMASTVKLPIAVYLLHRSEANNPPLTQMATIEPHDLSLGSGLMGYFGTWPGLSMSFYNLLESMMAISDNSSTDVILREIGGPEAVYKYLKSINLGDIYVSRNIMQMYSDTSGLEVIPPKHTWTLKKWVEWRKNSPEEIKKKQYRKFYEDQRDTTTPSAMSHLLIKLYNKELINEKNRDLLLDIIEHSWEGRIKKLLPKDILVSHKTGSWWDNNVKGSEFYYLSDVGIITLPNNKGHLALSIYTSSDKGSSPKKETDAIAKTARLIYDEFVR